MFDNYAKKILPGTGKGAVEGSALTDTGYRSDYNCITVATCCHYKNSEHCRQVGNSEFSSEFKSWP